jgi:hypothetical protein
MKLDEGMSPPWQLNDREGGLHVGQRVNGLQPMRSAAIFSGSVGNTGVGARADRADSLQEPDWPRIAERLNGFLGRTWPAPPWDGGQVATVAMCISLAQETTGD